MISKKRSSKLVDIVMQKSVDEIFDHINELVDAVNQPATEATPKTSGKTGDIRVVDAGGDHKLQIRTKDGWASLVDSTGAEITTKLS